MARQDKTTEDNSIETSADEAKGSKPGAEAVDLTRRTLLRGAAGAAAAIGGAGAAAAQGNEWWESILGAPRRSAPRREPVAARQERVKRQSGPPQDLRPGSVPWRSDEMLDAMDQAIAKYERVVRKGDWPRIPRGRFVRVGGYDERMPRVRRRLFLSGELSQDGARRYDGSTEFDRWLEVAVKRFQQSHGLRVTGFLNRSTIAQLNVSAEERLAQLKLNRRRIVALVNRRVEDRYVLVNAAAFQLEAVERYQVQRRHRVIVGKADRQTPEIQAQIQGLNFFPFWRVPESVASKDLIPRIRKEPDFLSKEHIRLVEGNFNGPEIDPQTIDWNAVDTNRVKFKQDPGPWNALGLLRINMPNKEIVYMHDTPMKPLFNQRLRAFSAGCVRVQDVFKLGAWIASYEPGFDEAEARVMSIINDQQPVNIKLTRPIPVYFTYLTAWAELDGSIEFRPDIYGRDGAAALRGENDEDAFRPGFTLSP
ncbi:MAG: L,D-transpeptidase family protein [Pseudomonadota bacterium]